MSSIKQHGMLGRRLWPVALIGAVLAVAAAGPSVALGASAGQHPRGKARAAQQQQPAINAQTDPDAAAAYAAGSPSNISWQTGTAPGGCRAHPAPATPVQQSPCVPAQNNQAHYRITDGWGTARGCSGTSCTTAARTQRPRRTTGQRHRKQSWSLSEKVSLKISVGVPNIVSVSDEVSAFSKQTTRLPQR